MSNRNINSTTTLKRAAYFDEKLLLQLFKEGKTFTEKGFFSVTHSEKALIEWIKINPTNVIFKVTGKNAKLIEDTAMIPTEHELVFKSGTSFDVISIKRIDHPLDITKRVIEIILKEQ